MATPEMVEAVPAGSFPFLRTTDLFGAQIVVADDVKNIPYLTQDLLRDQGFQFSRLSEIRNFSEHGGLHLTGKVPNEAAEQPLFATKSEGFDAFVVLMEPRRPKKHLDRLLGILTAGFPAENPSVAVWVVDWHVMETVAAALKDNHLFASTPTEFTDKLITCLWKDGDVLKWMPINETSAAANGESVGGGAAVGGGEAAARMQSQPEEGHRAGPVRGHAGARGRTVKHEPYARPAGRGGRGGRGGVRGGRGGGQGEGQGGPEDEEDSDSGEDEEMMMMPRPAPGRVLKRGRNGKGWVIQ